MSAHTPGPWGLKEIREFVRKGVEDVVWYDVTAKDAIAGNVTLAAGVDAEADARLIAAAPQMLEALREAAETLKRAVALNVKVPGFDPEEHVVVKRCRAAIAAAEGKVP